MNVRARAASAVLGVLFVLSGAGAGCAGCEQDRVDAVDAELQVTPESLAFGPVPVGLGVVQELSLLNPGRLELTVDARAVEGDAAAFRIVDLSVTVAPGGETLLRVEFRPEKEGPRAATLVLKSNGGAADVRVPLAGAGTKRSVCGDCNAPPANYCATSSALISYAPMGTCVDNACRYDAAVVACPGGCNAASADCAGAVDAGAVDPPDAGTPDAGTPDAGTPDAGTPDAGEACSSPLSYNICAGTQADCESALSGRQSECVARGCAAWTVTVTCQVGGSPSNAGCWGAQATCGDAAPPPPGPRTAWGSPGEYTFVVPEGVTQVRARLWGGGGAGGNQAGATGGGGAYVQGTFMVTPGESLDVWVAEGGQAFGDGAGAAWLRRGTTTLAVAAGGGGGGSDGCSGCKSGGRGGAGGAATGEAGQNLVTPLAPYCLSATGGQGGTQLAGGQGGTNTGSAQYRCNGNPGGPEVGGKSTSSGIFSCDVGTGADRWRGGGGQGNGGGGGGGAGWFGGGGAGFIWTYCSGGGGGGSSYADPSVTLVTQVPGQGQAQGNAADSQGAGRGGDAPATPSGNNWNPQPASNGVAGRVEVFY
ncbi:MAG: hypothetical protein FJ086_03510 [Deltaproteobacteria bacterium]|nr:hypothetical protein [Deltaproteobacteria bacterium]